MIDTQEITGRLAPKVVYLAALKKRSPLALIFSGRVVPVRYPKATETLLRSSDGKETFQPCLLIPLDKLVPRDLQRLAAFVATTYRKTEDQALTELLAASDYPAHQSHFLGVVEGEEKTGGPERG